MTTIDSIVKQLLIKKPFIGVFILGIKRHFGDICDTACVYRDGINCAICINEDFWNKLESDELREAILEHEIHHIIFKHIFQYNAFPDKNHLNIATDCHVNSFIPILQNDPWCYPSRFNLPDGEGTVFYYNNIPHLEKPPQSDDHDSWKDFSNLSDAEKELVSNQIDYRAKETAQQVSKTAGSIPGEFAGYIDSLFKQKPAIFNWKAYFRRMLGTILDINLKKTAKKESLYFPGQMGIKKKKKVSIMVAIDTSGSVSDSELCDFFSEINNIYKSGANIQLVEFDHAIQSSKKYTGTWDGSIHGRGGTSFSEPIDLYNKNRKEYSSLILFTDGYASISELNVMGPIIWVITSEGSHQDYPGHTIYIPKEN